MTYWWLVTTLIWVVLLIGWSKFFVPVITEAYASCYHQRLLYFMYPLFPLFPLFLLVPLVPLFPSFPLVPLVPSCPPLFPLVPPCSRCPPLFLLFPLFPLVPPWSPLFPCSFCYPLFPLVPFVPPVPPCSPVPLVHLQFTTLNVWQSQISVNKKKRSRFKRNPLKSQIPNHKHVTEKLLHLIWWRQLVWEIRKSGQNYEKMKQMFHPNYSDFISVVKWQVA